MKSKWILRGIGLGILFALFVIAMGYVVMQLWNWLMPDLFHLSQINYMQAVGLLALSRLLLFPFGGGRHWHHKNHGNWKYNAAWRKRWEEKVKNMTPEEKEKFRLKYESWCGCNYYTDKTEQHQAS